MRSRRFLVFLLIILIVCFAVTNSDAVNTIDDSAYVVAMGIDNGENGKLLLSFQIAIPSSDSSGSSSTSGDSQSTSSIVNTIECDTIYSGLNLVNSYLSKKINLSYCKVVVFSEEFASKGISEYISTFMNDVEIRPSCNILISKCNAKFFLENSKPLLETMYSKYYEMQLSSEKNTGYTKTITLLDFYNSYFDTFKQPFAILGTVNSPDVESAEVPPSPADSELFSAESLKDITSVESNDSGQKQSNIENIRLGCI